MKKLGPKGSKLLKSIHIIFVSIWVGGVASWLPLLFGSHVTEMGSTYLTYLSMRAIAWNVIGWGGMGSLFTGILNGIFTPWEIWKYKWVTVKFLIVSLQILFGIFFIEKRLLENISIIETEASSAVSNPVFLENHFWMQWGIAAQCCVFSLVIFISVWKPWGKNSKLDPKSA
ncbi:hypothetical protein EHO59_12520 [Leptospira semungkisensis]|uniref:DUF2269 family protein n=1 Tax=Leptospira semungkisensis TaxID=2484985 RepID=A0A4R9FPS4_9LEPT|nr:hypothetical protein [Leptospira semungkisensis]TGK00756.1 hypothetical protein EHO59_12520 [Leptospira semungkisensis]